MKHLTRTDTKSILKFDWLLSEPTPQVTPVAETRRQAITIGDEDGEVIAHQIGKAWTAYGYSHSKPIHVSGETAAAAFSQWRRKAKELFV